MSGDCETMKFCGERTKEQRQSPHLVALMVDFLAFMFGGMSAMIDFVSAGLLVTSLDY
jgi:hypothetical protein